MSTKRRPSAGHHDGERRLAKRPSVMQGSEYLERELDQSPSFEQTHADYTIAWICALHFELAASRLMFDKEHPPLPAYEGDRNVYILGQIAQHNVVMTALPVVYGKVNAASVGTDLKRSFPNIRATLMVGIGGGAPGQADLYLGDVVVGTRVMEYDLGKAKANGEFEITASDKHPSTLLRNAATNLRSKHGLERWSPRAQELLRLRLPQYRRPKQPDRLFQASYLHPEDAKECDKCDMTKLQTRRQRLAVNFHIHYGGVASGDSVNKDVSKRDAVARRLDIICFEMEAAGIMDSLQCLPIRGICDYSDSHKNKDWQEFAAATAASYARELLETIPVVATRVRSDPAVMIASQARCEPESGTATVDRSETLLELIDFPQSSRRKEIIRAEQGKTCRWFLTHPKFVFWTDLTRRTETGSLLWLRGKAGAGKSTLIKFLFLGTKKRHSGATVVSFFFNARGDTLEKSITGMYRSILWQVLTLLPDLQSVLSDPEIISENLDLACPSLILLKALLASAVSKLGDRSLLCFVDALDECDEDDARDMVEYFESLIEEAQVGRINFRVMFSSRPYPYIHMEERCLVTLENEVGHGQDLAQYVGKCLRIPAKPRAELEGKILEKASGVFMWVVLVVGILNKEASHGGLALRKRLSEIPPTLSQLFKDILTRDQERPHQLRRCVLWVLCARRPLTPGEFRHAMWAGGLAAGDVDDEVPDSTDEELNAVLATSSSKGLVEVVSTKKNQEVVQFIHESVRDFLVKDKGLQELWPDMGFHWEAVSHEMLRNDCEAYLDRCFVWSKNATCDNASTAVEIDAAIAEVANDSEGEPVAPGASVDQTTPDVRNSKHLPLVSKSFVLVEYATQNILQHADRAAPSTPQEDFLIRFFSRYNSDTLDLYQPVKRRRFGVYKTPLQMLAALGTSHLIRSRGKTGDSIKSNPRHATYHPLLIAMTNGHRDATAALLGIPSTIHEGTDLMEGLKADSKGIYRRSPMTWAAQEGRCALMSLLATNSLSMSDRDNNQDTPLRRAAGNGQVAALRLLLDCGVSVSDFSYCDTISYALNCGQEAAAVFLLERLQGWQNRSVISLSDFSYWLSWSIKRGFEKAVRLLLDHGANADGNNYIRPIVDAAPEGHLHIIELLVNQGAQVNITSIIDDDTALIKASRYGQGKVVEFLVGHGADVNAVTKNGYSALMVASQKCHTIVVEFLIEHGADLHTTNKIGETALEIALDNGHTEVAQLIQQAINIKKY